MSAEIREIDPRDDVALDGFYDVWRASVEHDRRDTAVVMDREGWRVGMRNPTSHTRTHLRVVMADGVPVAAGSTGVRLTDNLDAAIVDVQVHPNRRRRGHGSALLAALEEIGRSEGRTLLHANAQWPAGVPMAESKNHRFAVRHGYRVGVVDQQRRLDLPVVVDLDALAEEAAARHPGYRLVGWHGPAPEEYVVGLAALDALVSAESPTGEVELEPQDPDPRLVRETEAVLAERGQRIWSAIALAPDGEVAAMTQLSTRAAGSSELGQWGTIVRHDHRGHRLGLAVKVANLRQLTTASYSCVTTWNAATNDHMIAVNERLGFRLVEAGGFFQKVVGR